jgi:hypothetical protein
MASFLAAAVFHNVVATVALIPENNDELAD